MPELLVTMNEESLKTDLSVLVRKTAGDTLNGLLEEEADDLAAPDACGRTTGREAYRAGHYDWSLIKLSGEVAIRRSKARDARLAMATVGRCRRRETPAEEAMIEACLASRIEGVSEFFWGPGASASTVPDPDGRAFSSVEEWRGRPLERACPHACVEGTCLKRSWGGSYGSVAVMVAISAADDGCREAVGAAEGLAESPGCRRELLSWLKSRGLRGVRTLAGDKADGMAGPIAEVFPGAACQRLATRLCRSVLARVPKSRRLRGPSATATPRRRRTPGSPASTGGGSEPATPSSGPTARYAGARAWSAPSPTGTPPSCS